MSFIEPLDSLVGACTPVRDFNEREVVGFVQSHCGYLQAVCTVQGSEVVDGHHFKSFDSMEFAVQNAAETMRTA